MRHRKSQTRSLFHGRGAAFPLLVAVVALGIQVGCTVPRLSKPTERQAPNIPSEQPAESESISRVAEQLLAEGQFLAAANAYDQLAAQSPDTGDQLHFRLTAIEILFDNAQFDLGESRLSALPSTLISSDLAQRKQLLDARLALVDGDAEAALAQLPAETDVVTPRALERFHALRADAASAADQPGKALASLINLDLLEGGANRDMRNLQIWDLLATQETASLTALYEAYEDPLPRGWLQLALDIEQVRKQRSELVSTVENWKARYPGHPALNLLTAYNDVPQQLFSSQRGNGLFIGEVKNVALLLPFTDRLQSFSGAIRDGAMTSLIGNGAGVSLQVYDVGESSSGALGAYQRAVADGADLAIGPLRRNAALALATSSELQVPVLSLNYLNDGNVVDNLIQFGLSPEDEARNAADFIVGNGLLNAAVIHPATDAGLRSAQAFSERFALWGGAVLATAELPRDAADFRTELNSVLLTDRSLARRRKLESTLGISLTFETQQREDIEAVFMPVSAALGRVLKPQLDFHGAGHVPVVSTSLIYGARAQAEADRDINDVYFNDIPWLLNGAAGEVSARQAAQTLGVSEGPLARFFALGSDAMTLVLNLPALSRGDVTSLAGQTGELTLSDGRIRRKLPFAQFVRGLPKRTEFIYPGEPELLLPVDADPTSNLLAPDPAPGPAASPSQPTTEPTG